MTVQVYIEIKDGSKLPPKDQHPDGFSGRKPITTWGRQFVTVPRYGDAYHYEYVPKDGEWKSGPDRTALAKAFVVGIEWRPAPAGGGIRLPSELDVPYVIIDEHDPFNKTT